VAGAEERETWQRVRESLSEITFRDERRDVDTVLDPLTGLISRGYWDESLLEKQEELGDQSYSIIYARVDEMDWLKEQFPQRRYAEQLIKQTARTFLAHMKNLAAGGIHMEAVRAEENGLLLLVTDELKAAVPMAEHLRKAHREQLKELGLYREAAERRKGKKPCGTLALGVAQHEKGETLQETLNRAKEAASEAATEGDRAMVYSVGVLMPCRDFIEDSP
jgi:GGDEF domain-containing protein